MASQPLLFKHHFFTIFSGLYFYHNRILAIDILNKFYLKNTLGHCTRILKSAPPHHYHLKTASFFRSFRITYSNESQGFLDPLVEDLPHFLYPSQHIIRLNNYKCH